MSSSTTFGPRGPGSRSGRGPGLDGDSSARHGCDPEREVDARLAVDAVLEAGHAGLEDAEQRRDGSLRPLASPRSEELSGSLHGDGQYADTDGAGASAKMRMRIKSGVTLTSVPGKGEKAVDRFYDEALADHAREELKAWMAREGVVQGDAGRALGVVQSTVNRVLRGQQPSMKFLIALREKTGKSLDDLLGLPALKRRTPGSEPPDGGGQSIAQRLEQLLDEVKKSRLDGATPVPTRAIRSVRVVR